MTLPIPVPENFRIIAHRGASAYVPENTLQAFQLAFEMGVHEVELDTQLSTDGEVALCHDAILVRYGHGQVVVETLPWAKLADLDMGSWMSPHLYSDARMITLDQLFEAYGDSLTYHVEIKGHAPQLPTAVFAQIQHYGLADSCIITSFAYDALVAMRAIAPDIRMGWLIRAIDQEAIKKAQELHLFQLCPFAGTVTADMVQYGRQVVEEVRSWGISGTTAQGQSAEVIELIHRVLDAGCDGMTINWPDWVRHESGHGNR